MDRVGVALFLAAVVAGCGGGTMEAPSASMSYGLPPDVSGRVVMVLPVQAEVGVRGDADAELAFALTALESDVDWVFRARLESAIERSPGLGARTTGLPVGMFLRREVQRVGDPLYGDLRRLAALVNADIALIPVLIAPGKPEVTDEVDEAGEPVELVQDGQVTLEITIAMMDVRSGRVMWFGVVAGEPGELGGPAVLASVMDSLARRLLWYVLG